MLLACLELPYVTVASVRAYPGDGGEGRGGVGVAGLRARALSFPEMKAVPSCAEVTSVND